MKIIANYQGEEILLKNYNSYLSLDKTLSLFESKEELMEKLGLDPDFDSLMILDNNGIDIPFDAKTIRETIAFYEQGKGDEFVDWIYNSSCSPKSFKTNAIKLSSYFILRLDELNKDLKNKANPETNRLKKIVKTIKSNLEMFRAAPEALNEFRQEIVPHVRSYLTKKGSYDYAYMRKFASTLVSFYEYELDDPKIVIKETSLSEKEQVLESFKIAIHNYFYPKRQVTFDDLDILEEQEPIYDENGIKIDEKEFLEEFINNKKLYKGI